MLIRASEKKMRPYVKLLVIFSEIANKGFLESHKYFVQCEGAKQYGSIKWNAITHGKRK